jgi:hypothetical protein
MLSKIIFYLGQEVLNELPYMCVMTNKQTKEKKMKNVKVKEEARDTSALSILGGLLIVFAIADFGLSWTGVNLTGFLGPVSRFTPMIFGFIGESLLSAGKESG